MTTPPHDTHPCRAATRIDAAANRVAQSRPRTLVEALPWLERFRAPWWWSSTAATPWSMTTSASFAQDIVFLRYAGLRPVVVHGGGPQIASMLDRLGLETSSAAACG